MKIKNNLLKSALLTLSSLAVGFAAIAFPFNLFSTLTSDAMHVVFISEIIIYFFVAMIFLVVADKKKQRRIKLEQRHEKRKAKIERVKTDWIDIAA